MEKEKSNPVGWFEIPVTDMDRAEGFYKAVLGYDFTRQEEKNGMLMSWFPMDMDPSNIMYGATGTLVRGEIYTPSHQGTTIYFSVADIEDILSKAEDNGGKTLLPKMSIGEHGFIGWMEDSEGNRIAVHAMS